MILYICGESLVGWAVDVGGCCQVYQPYNCSTLLALGSWKLISTFLSAPKFCCNFHHFFFFFFPILFCISVSQRKHCWMEVTVYIESWGVFALWHVHFLQWHWLLRVWKRLHSCSAITSHLIILLYLLPVAHPSHAGPSPSASALVLSHILTSLVCFLCHWTFANCLFFPVSFLSLFAFWRSQIYNCR